MTSRNHLFAVVTLPICAAILLAGAWFASAGDLNPPAGPVAPTHKTLTEVEPRIAINATNTPGDADSVFKITQPGSYYLSGNVTGVSGKHGIEVSVGAPPDPVSIDLNGYTLKGVTGSLSGVLGLRALIRNGFVEFWGQDGIDISQGVVENVVALACGDNGIEASWGTIVRNCVAESNTGNGISLADVSRIESCVVKVNVGWGIKADGACIIERCMAYNNTLGGINGGMSTTVRGCQLFSNAVGIEVSSDCLVVDNNLNANGKGVFVTGSRCRIEGNNATASVKGFDIDGTGNIIVKNTAKGNTTNFEFPLGIQNTVGEIVTGALVLDATNSSAWANFEF